MTTPQPSDLTLQLALAKMLSEQLELREVYLCTFHDWHWKHERSGIMGRVRPTEWLHIVWLVEQGLEVEQRINYVAELWYLHRTEKNHYGTAATPKDYFNALTASWQQRAIALCKVKGVEL